jgi:hypothetical protein
MLAAAHVVHRRPAETMVHAPAEAADVGRMAAAETTEVAAMAGVDLLRCEPRAKRSAQGQDHHSNRQARRRHDAPLSR